MTELFNNFFVKIGETIVSSSANKVSSDFRPYWKHSTLKAIVLDAPQPVEIPFNTLNPSKASKMTSLLFLLA